MVLSFRLELFFFFKLPNILLLKMSNYIYYHKLIFRFFKTIIPVKINYLSHHKILGNFPLYFSKDCPLFIAVKIRLILQVRGSQLGVGWGGENMTCPRRTCDNIWRLFWLSPASCRGRDAPKHPTARVSVVLKVTSPTRPRCYHQI